MAIYNSASNVVLSSFMSISVSAPLLTNSITKSRHQLFSSTSEDVL